MSIFVPAALFASLLTAHLRAFMTRCSTSSTGNLVSPAIAWNDMALSLLGRRKTASMSAIRQIF
jgi:hypothetical protein